MQDVAEISLEELLQSAVMDIYHPAQQANIDVRLQLNAHDVIRTGQPLLYSLSLHGMTVSFGNAAEGGFEAVVSW